MAGENKSIGRLAGILRLAVFPEIVLLSIGLLLLAFPVFGQTIKEFKEIWVNESREYLRNNQKPLPYLQSGFYYFARIQDDAFTEVLENNWEKYSVSPPSPVPKSHKFDPAPEFRFEESSYHDPKFLPCFRAETNREAEGKVSANLPRIRKPEYISSGPLKLNFKFYGNNVVVYYDKLLGLSVNQPVSNEVVTDFWKKLMVGNSQYLISQLMTVRNRLGLNDWGYFMLVKSCSSALSPNDDSGSVLLTWGLMIKSGFDVKIGYNQLGASVLFPAVSKINSIPYLKINGNDYYIDRSISSFPVTTYPANHLGATGFLHLRMNQSLNFQGEVQIKKFQFLWDKKLVEFSLKYNPEVTRFLEEYPQSDPDLFFLAPFTSLTEESLLKQIRTVLAGMKKEEAVAFLQQFVQKSFAYFPYNDRYGFDRFMFPEELLSKDESNDKGKAVLFAWMVSNLLNQKAALVEFPGFYSVGISMDQQLDGDNFLVDGRSYTMADPTFDNAPLGLVMKEFYLQKPSVRPLTTESEEAGDKEKIWKIAIAFGANRSGSVHDYLKDENGSSYITGFFNERTANSMNSCPSPFIAKFDPNSSLVWMVKFRSDNRAFGLELKQLEKNEFYLAGSFRGKLECSGQKLETSPAAPDLFFVQFNRQGTVEWMTKSGLDQLEEDTKLFYTVRFTRSGDIQSVQLANEDERIGTTGFQQSTNEGLCYIASRYQSTGLDKAGEEATQKSMVLFRQNLNRLKLLGIDQITSCLTATFQCLLNSGNQLTHSDMIALGMDIAQTKDSTLTNFSETIQKFTSVNNNNGIIEIRTINGIPLKISSFRIQNRSHLKIIPLDNNDLKIKVLDGMEFESGSLRKKINSMILEHSTGNIVLDLGTEQLIVTRNLSREILTNR